MDTDPAMLAARAKLAAKLGGAKTGGKGSVRRKKVTKHHDHAADEKKIQGSIKKYGWQHIPDIREVNMFREEGTIIHFANPRFEASQQLSGYMVTGRGEEKKLEELLPGILPQLDKEDLATLQKMAREFAMAKGKGKGKGGKGGKGDGDDDEFGVGDMNFEEQSKK